ncbi:MAG: hypothetical protein IMZ67_01890 [Acidobacteria bacterium]|nr:hypothetical protein [Acidobacteriota bacterium]
MRTLESLENELAALPDEQVLPDLAMTVAERNAITIKRHVLKRQIHNIRAATSALAEIAPRLADVAKWRDDLAAWRQTLCDELMALPQRARTGPELGRLQNLKFSIMTIDRGAGASDGTGWEKETLRLGALMRASGYVPATPVEGQAYGRLPWFGSLPDTEQRLAELQRRRDAAAAVLEDALLDDDERARRAAAALTAAAARPSKLRGYAPDGTLPPI